MKRLLERMRSVYNKLNSELFANFNRTGEAIMDNRALLHLAPLHGSFVPYTDASVRPCDLLKIANDIIVNRRTTLLEIGAGGSTLILARLMKQTGGHLISIEHDSEWAEWIQERLDGEKLGSHAVVIACSLIEGTPGKPGWYDLDKISSSLAGRSIDSLVIDGPPAYKEGMEKAREPAVCLLRQYFSANVSIFLDDIDRPGERAIADTYTTILGEDFQYLQLSRTMGMWYRGHFYSI